MKTVTIEGIGTFDVGPQDGHYKESFGGKRVSTYPLRSNGTREGTLHVGFDHHWACSMWWAKEPWRVSGQDKVAIDLDAD